MEVRTQEAQRPETRLEAACLAAWQERLPLMGCLRVVTEARRSQERVEEGFWESKDRRMRSA